MTDETLQMSWQDWPTYSALCRRDVQRLLQDGRSLTAYLANRRHGPEPTEGSWAWKLEREAERVHQVKYVIACANGTVALRVLLTVLYPAGGEVITTAFTFSATVAAILHAGLTPVFADVHPTTGILDPASVARMTTHRTVGYLPVDLFGQQSWAGANPVDACQAVGLRPVATHGVWSFNGRKNVPAGEGGAIFTHDADVAAHCRLLIGHAENFLLPWVGGNGHLNEVTACLAYHGMKTVQHRNAHRTKMAMMLNHLLTESNGPWERVVVPDLTTHALYRYALVLTHGGMGRVADRLAHMGVECQRGYIQPPLHRYRAFQWLRRDALPTTEALSHDRLLLFPQVTPTATRREMEQLGEQIVKVLRRTFL